MNAKIAFVLIACLAMTPVVAADAHAFSLFGIDFGAAFGGFFGGTDDSSNEPVPDTLKPQTTTTTNTTPKPPSEPRIYSFVIADVNYTEAMIKASVNGDESLRGYISAFSYECMALKSDKGVELTASFDVDSGEVTKVRPGIDCDRTIEFEEALITDIQENGFQVSKAGDYMGQAKIPTSVYFKALQVFTVG